MLRLQLDEIQEADLVRLGQDQIPESLRLEFKRELDLSNRQKKAEAAKDVSALANTDGGRILYGIDETELPDGSTVASTIYPLTDGDIDSRLADVLLASIHPRPRFRTRKVSVPGGFVLIIEVYPSYGNDLYMVTGFKEHRFYRRAEQRTILMEEPEIREAYVRVAATRRQLDESVEAMIRSELSLVPRTTESVIVVPWFGHRDLVNPRQFGEKLRFDLINGPLRGNDWCSIVSELSIVADGYRAHGPRDNPCHECLLYAAIRRNGLVHLAMASSLAETPPPGKHASLPIDLSLEGIVAALVVARYMLDNASYWGPVRVIHQIRSESSFFVQAPGHLTFSILRPADAGSYQHEIPAFTFAELGSSFKPLLVELLHQIYQTGGMQECPWFTESGDLTSGVERFLPRVVLEHLQ